MTSVKTNEVLAGVLEGRRWMHISRNVSSIVILRSLKTRRADLFLVPGSAGRIRDRLVAWVFAGQRLGVDRSSESAGLMRPMQ